VVAGARLVTSIIVVVSTQITNLIKTLVQVRLPTIVTVTFKGNKVTRTSKRIKNSTNQPLSTFLHLVTKLHKKWTRVLQVLHQDNLSVRPIINIIK
jgi:hypothetical protein